MNVIQRILIVAVVLCSSDCCRRVAADRPNVLFVAIDDLNDWVNCLGGYEGTVHTPNIDRLAARGTLFTNAHCASPKCAPSRTALLTGRRPSTTGLYDNSHWWLPNLPDVVTIPAHFRAHGYRVAGAGKIFHHTAGNHPPNQWHQYLPLRFREDPWFRGSRRNYPWSKHEPFPTGFPYGRVRGLGHENDWGALPIEDAEYDDAVTTDYVVQFLQQNQSQPFFLAYGLFRPHLPWYVPQRFFDRYPLEDIQLPPMPEDDLDDIPPAGQKFAGARRSDLEAIIGADRHRHAVQAYLASITCTDERLGRVLQALDQSPHANNTIVVLWSDHGWHLGEKQHWHKTTLWEEATRVPLIISVPGKRSAVCGRAVSLLDIFPTLNDLAELAPIETLDGVSLKPLLDDPNTEWLRPAVCEYRRGNAAVRSERYRYIRYQDGGEELYDHRDDPYEWNNLADSRDHQHIRGELSKWLPRKWAPSADRKDAFRFDPETFTWVHRKTGMITDGRDAAPLKRAQSEGL